LSAFKKIRNLSFYSLYLSNFCDTIISFISNNSSSSSIEFRASDPVTFGIVYNLIFGLSKVVGGILFGIAFWTIAKKLGQTQVREYMVISAYGLILLFVSNQAIFLVNYNYPPFGFATVS